MTRPFGKHTRLNPVEVNPDLEERMRQCEVVAKIAIQTRAMSIGGKKSGRRSIIGLAKEEFGLTRSQARICIGRAQNLLAEVERLSAIRRPVRLRVLKRSDESNVVAA